MTTATCLVTINRRGIIQSVDNNCSEMFGYSIAELIGQPVTILVPSPYKEQHDSYLNNYHCTGQAKIIGRSRTVEGQHKDGTIFTIKLAVSEINAGDNTIYIGLITKLEDTTAILTIDREAIIVTCNANCEKLWGYTPEELIGNNIRMLMPSPHREQHDQYLRNYKETGKMKVIGTVRNVPALHKNGIVFPVCLQVQRVRINDAEIFRGKVERVEEERELVFTLNADGIILSCNKNFIIPLMGYSEHELQGKSISVLIKALRTNQRERKRKFHSISELPHKLQKHRELDSIHHAAAAVASAKVPVGEIPSASPKHNSADLINDTAFHKVSRESIENWVSAGAQFTECEHKDRSCFTVSMTITKFTNSETVFYAAKIKRISDASIEGKAPHILHPVKFNTQTTIGDNKYCISSQPLGSGSYGKVRLGRNSETNETVAIKILQKDVMDEAELTRSLREIDILKRLRHPNICCLYDSYEYEDRIYLVMEYARGGELFTYINERGKISEEEALYFFRQILRAVDFCHLNSVIHRDLKHKNILLDENCNVKLIDFGLSNFTEEGELRGTFCGTPAYSAPEMIMGRKYYGPEVDVWSLGVVLYTMLCGEFPFNTMADITNGKFAPLQNVSSTCRDIIQRMLTVDTNMRAKIEELQNHPFVAGGEFKEVLPDLDPKQLPELQVPLDLVQVIDGNNSSSGTSVCGFMRQQQSPQEQTEPQQPQATCPHAAPPQPSQQEDQIPTQESQPNSETIR